MTKNVLTITILITLFLTSCKESKKQENTGTKNTEVSRKSEDEIVNSTLSDKEGNKLEMTFNNTKDMATLNYNGEKIELVGQKPASGIWYKNDHYELRGKGEDIELTKDGKVVFKSK